MKFCGKPMPKAKNGADRGFCTRPQGHNFKHGNSACFMCGDLLMSANASPSTIAKGGGRCRDCFSEYMRTRTGCQPRNFQHPGHTHTFPCGCSGVLPMKLSPSNEFAIHGSQGSGFLCRVSRILTASMHSAREGGYKPIPKDTPHSVIRLMMARKNCVLCGKILLHAITLGCEQNPLHHDHETGEPLGFTHRHCNPWAMEQEIDRLKSLLKTKGIKS